MTYKLPLETGFSNYYEQKIEKLEKENEELKNKIEERQAVCEVCRN